MSILCGVISLHAAIEQEVGVPGPAVNCNSKDFYMQSNGRFLNNGERGMLREKDYHAVDIVFPIIRAYVGRARGF